MSSVFQYGASNVCLGLASDGFYPYSTLSTTYSTCRVVLVPCDLPTWRCMKQPYMVLPLLILGPTSPCKEVDVYLRPLVDELKELLFDGVNTYDNSMDETFKMWATILWAISDFPAYAMLSGWSTKGKLACPLCNKHTWSLYLKNLKKALLYGPSWFLADRSHVSILESILTVCKSIEWRQVLIWYWGVEAIRWFWIHIRKGQMWE